MNDRRSKTHSRGSDRSRSRTDLDYLDRVTDAEIEAAMDRDSAWKDLKDVDWSKAVLVIPPKKTAISIRVDEDVLDYFRKQGSGYQRRMNAVLRSYMQQDVRQKRKKRA
jgi:uncharacterized protein (DUF4415 family)